MPPSWAGTHPSQWVSFTWDHPIIPLAVYTSLHLNRRTLQTVHTDPPTPNVISPPHPDHPATIDQNPIPELHSLPTSLRLKHYSFEVSPSLRGPGPRQRSGSRDTHEKRHHPVVHPPSRVPVHSREALNKDLDIQESLGIIEPVEGPTP